MWKIILVLVALLIYIMYNIVVIKLFNIPHSLSQTYYLFKDYNDKFKVLFPMMMIGVAIILLPAWLEISDGSDFQFTVFLSCVGLIPTGITPAFNKNKKDNIIHTVSAYFAACISFLWIIMLTDLWYIILILGVIIGFIGLFFRKWGSSYTYLLENIAIF